LGAERRRRWSAAEKVSMVRETYEPGMTVSLVARRHGINPNQLFHWRKLERIGALTAVEAGETVVPAAELETLGPVEKRNVYYKDLPREITDELWRQFKAGIEPLKRSGKLAAVHFQFAPWVAYHPKNREHIDECQRQ
jgi:transposase-like protein